MVKEKCLRIFRSRFIKDRENSPLEKISYFLFTIFLLSIVFVNYFGVNGNCNTSIPVKLGNELLLEKYFYLVENKKIGLVTNQTGVDSKGHSFIDNLINKRGVKLVALYAPEHGLDGTAKAGAWIKSYIHPYYDIPVYSLYGNTRMPTQEMLLTIEMLLFDIQDIGARTYTYMSTLQYCLVAAEKYNKPVIVLDRPNPLGGMVVEGPVLEDKFKSFMGVDNLPMAHGMTAGELAIFYNRQIGADLTVISMEGYQRDMSYKETRLPFIPTSPNIPDMDSLYGYMATGLGEGTGVCQRDKFRWIGGEGLDAFQYAEALNKAELPGVNYFPEIKGTAGGAHLEITDPHAFNPAKSGIYALAYAFILGNFHVPKSSDDQIVMFDKIMGTDMIGIYLEQKVRPQQIEASYAPGLQSFKEERKHYLIPEYGLTEG